MNNNNYNKLSQLRFVLFGKNFRPIKQKERTLKDETQLNNAIIKKLNTYTFT